MHLKVESFFVLCGSFFFLQLNGKNQSVQIDVTCKNACTVTEYSQQAFLGLAWEISFAKRFLRESTFVEYQNYKWHINRFNDVLTLFFRHACEAHGVFFCGGGGGTVCFEVLAFTFSVHFINKPLVIYATISSQSYMKCAKWHKRFPFDQLCTIAIPAISNTRHTKQKI